MAVIGKIPMSVDKLKEWIAYDPINVEADHGDSR